MYMKLFLTSQTISKSQGQHFMKLVGTDKPSDIKIALIENAADTYADADKVWLYESRADIQAHGFQLDIVDLEDYRFGKKGLLQRLEKSDAIWMSGGNTYYLRWILRETRAGTIIQKLAKQGKVIGGSSAGAIVVGATLKHFELADDPADAPEVIYDGLNLTDTVVIPHWGNEKYGVVMKDAEQQLQNDGYKTVHITDEQAFMINDDQQKNFPLS